MASFLIQLAATFLASCAVFSGAFLYAKRKGWLRLAPRKPRL